VKNVEDGMENLIIWGIIFLPRQNFPTCKCGAVQKLPGAAANNTLKYAHIVKKTKNFSVARFLLYLIYSVKKSRTAARGIGAGRREGKKNVKRRNLKQNESSCNNTRYGRRDAASQSYGQQYRQRQHAGVCAGGGQV
jgi:hypothetical protein